MGCKDLEIRKSEFVAKTQKIINLSDFCVLREKYSRLFIGNNGTLNFIIATTEKMIIKN